MQAENLRVLARVITALGWTVLALSLIAALAQAIWLIAYTQQIEAFWMLTAAGAASWFNTLAFLGSIIPVMIWIYTAHNNLHKAGLTGLRYSPGWATFSFLVPVANLYVPFVALRELANRSAGEPEELAEAEVNEVTSLWGCFLGSMFLSTIVAITTFIDLLPRVFMTTPFWANPVLTVLSLIMTAGAAYFLIKLVQLVTHSQMTGASEISVFE